MTALRLALAKWLLPRGFKIQHVATGWRKKRKNTKEE